MLFIKTFFCAVIYCTAFFSFTALSAQEYPKVNEVRVEFDGFKSVSEEFVFSNVQLRTGMNYNTALVDQSIRTLYGTGHFEFVEVKVENSDVAKRSPVRWSPTTSQRNLRVCFRRGE